MANAQVTSERQQVLQPHNAPRQKQPRKQAKPTMPLPCATGVRVVPPDEQEDSEQLAPSAWHRLMGQLQRSKLAVEHAHSVFGGFDDKAFAAVSVTTRRRQAVRCTRELEQASQQLEAAAKELSYLQGASQTWQAKLANMGGKLRQAEAQLSDKSSQLSFVLDKLEASAAGRSEAQGQANSLLSQVDGYCARIARLEEQCESAAFRAAEAESFGAAEREAAEKLRRQVADLQAKHQDAERALQASNSQCSTSSGLVARQQDMVAALTADNLVYIVKLRAAEQDAAKARREADAIRAALDEQQGPWFDEVRAGVQHRVRQALQQAHAAEQQLSDARQAHGAESDRLRQAAESAAEAQRKAQEREEALTQQLAAAQQAVQRCKADMCAASAARDAAEARRREAAAEIAVLQQALEASRGECMQLKVEGCRADERIQGLSRRLAEQEAQLQEAEAAARQLQSQLDGQARVNSQLMARKQDVEWQLLTALAGGGGGSGGMQQQEQRQQHEVSAAAASGGGLCAAIAT